MKLLVDIGNHRLKWATSAQLERGISASAAGIQSMDISGPGFTDSLGALQESVGRPVAVWAASVAGEEVNRVLSAWVRAAWGLDVVFLNSTARACGIVNGYEQPGTLGVDRWAAIVAACIRAPGNPILIIDAGTAVTIDYVGTDRIYRGGVIVPGLHAMFQSLNLSTAQIRAYTGHESGQDLVMQNPDTRGAVENGVRLALTGTVENAVDHYAALAGRELMTFAAGGDAAWIQARCNCEMEVVPELVLEGVNALAGQFVCGGTPA